MQQITLRDILISARQESVQMRHHYLGVEHLFIALLEIQDGLARGILEEQGLAPDYVIDTIRRKAGKGIPERLWVGIPYTPRAEIILNIANDLALDNGRNEINERDLLNAILAEHDSLPTRVLKSLKADMAKLVQAAQHHTPKQEPQLPNITIDFGAEFDRSTTIEREFLFILRRMFSTYAAIRIERRLTGFKNAMILVVTPIDAEGRQSSSVVVKIDQTDTILDEAHRYDSHVKSALPLLTARLEEAPTTPDNSDLAGLKYTLVANSGIVPQDLRIRAKTLGFEGIGRLLREKLYQPFSKTWWQQRRPYRFQVWSEYDWMLPPILTLDYMPETEPPPNAHFLRIPFSRGKLKSRLQEMSPGDVVVVENFSVQRVDREKNILKLAIGYGTEADKRAYKIDVRGIHKAKGNFYRGEIVDRIIGTVWKTRHEILVDAVRALSPDFDINARTITIGNARVPNPLFAYEDLLDRHLNGSVSKIHGDLHLGNILVGPNNDTWLIDFAHARDGHSICDWANVEISLLGDVVALLIDGEWNTVREVIRHISLLNSEAAAMPVDPLIEAAVFEVAAIRQIAQQCLTSKKNWSEYYLALALVALRAITWEAMSLSGRRMMFLLSGVAMRELGKLFRSSIGTETPSPDDTAYSNNPITAGMTEHTPIGDMNVSTPDEIAPPIVPQQGRGGATRKLPPPEELENFSSTDNYLAESKDRASEHRPPDGDQS